MKFEYPEIIVLPCSVNSKGGSGGRSGMGMCKNTYTIKCLDKEANMNIHKNKAQN